MDSKQQPLNIIIKVAMFVKAKTKLKHYFCSDYIRAFLSSYSINNLLSKDYKAPLLFIKFVIIILGTNFSIADFFVCALLYLPIQSKKLRMLTFAINKSIQWTFLLSIQNHWVQSEMPFHTIISFKDYFGMENKSYPSLPYFVFTGLNTMRYVSGFALPTITIEQTYHADIFHSKILAFNVIYFPCSAFDFAWYTRLPSDISTFVRAVSIEHLNTGKQP